MNRVAVSSYERSEVRCTLKTEHRMINNDECYEKATVRKHLNLSNDNWVNTISKGEVKTSFIEPA